MSPATTATPRVEKYVFDRLKAAVAPLVVYPEFSGITARHVRYVWSGSGDIHYQGGNKVVRTAYLIYVAQGVTAATGRIWASDLQADADKIDAALDPGPPIIVNGRSIDGSRRDGEHYYPVWDNNVLQEVQLGGMYLVVSSVA